MKKTILLVLILAFLISLMPFATAAPAAIKVSLLSQSPDPVEPGQIITVKFKVENEGDATQEDVILELKPSYPFSFYGTTAKKNIGKLSSSIEGNDAVVVQYKLKVDEEAVEGENELELIVHVGDAISKNYDKDQFLIDVQTHDAVLEITSIVSSPNLIPPGDSARITINVKNLADSLLKDIHFKLDLTDDDLPLAPFQSSSERILAQLNSGFQQGLTFNLIADPKATPGLYKVPLEITYNDEKGNSNQIDDVLAVSVGSKPQIKPHIKRSTIYQDATKGKITLELANAGPDDLKFVELYLEPSDAYELLTSSNYFYIGDIDHDDTESEEIDLYINRGIKDFDLPVRIVFYDASNQQFQQNFYLPLELYSGWQMRKFGLKEGGKGWFYFLIIILAAGAFFYYKKYYKKRKRKKVK